MINEKLLIRGEHLCELCRQTIPTHEYIVDEVIGYELNNVVAICNNCLVRIKPEDNNDQAHWQCLAASIWSEIIPVQALCYRILYLYKNKEWAQDIINSVELSDSIIDTAIGIFKVVETHKDAYGIPLENGDTVVLTQVLNVKGANFMAPKGTIVKKIKLVHDNVNQIEGKINDQTIVILTQFVKKG